MDTELVSVKKGRKRIPIHDASNLNQYIPSQGEEDESDDEDDGQPNSHEVRSC